MANDEGNATARLKARNRANQAASRARTKARVAALEAQADRRREQDVAATTEVQRAARRVATENARLRTLLAALGVHDEQVRAWLDEGRLPYRATTTAMNVPATAMTTTIAMNKEEEEEDDDDDEEVHSTSDLRDGRGSANNSAGVKRRKITASQRTSSCQDVNDDGGSANESNTLSKLKTSAQQDGQNAAAAATAAIDETACEDAAMIIASMRGGSRPEDVWSELGCGLAKTCLVKNSKIFDLADSRPDR